MAPPLRVAFTKLVSWHEVDLTDKAKTLCGLKVRGPLQNYPNGNEKTCENCYTVHLARERGRMKVKPKDEE